MAHEYSSFATAFSALQTRWITGKTNYDYSITAYNNAVADWLAGNDHAAIADILTAIASDRMALNAIAAYEENTSDRSELMECFYWLGQVPPSYVLTWQKIIAAWTYNEYECAVATIMTMDKMRRIAWDKPFLLDPKWI